MPNPQFTKPWHGVPREQIEWNPTVIEDACIGCGTCVTGCSRLVYRFDFDRKKPVVVDPLNCMVGCTTCANTCPAHAIAFPPIETVLALEGQAQVRHAIEDDLLARHDILASTIEIPHPDRIVTLSVSAIEAVGLDLLRLRLTPVAPGDCFCEFTPGQYIELWEPSSTHMSRAYSIANAPDGSGAIELHIRRVEGGRFSDWVFKTMKVGDRVLARGPLGQFTIRSMPDVPLLFVAGGTGLAPILAMLRQISRSEPARDLHLIWGMKKADEFYALPELKDLVERTVRLRIALAAETGLPPPDLSDRFSFELGTPIDVLDRRSSEVAQHDIYAAGPSTMLRALAERLRRWEIPKDRIHLDAFSV